MNKLLEMNIYENIRTTVAEEQKKVYSTVNFVMVETYWNIGKQIYEAQGENERAEYGVGLLKYLSEKLTTEFGKGFTVANLKNMRQFYLTFPNSYALRSQLSWTHYRLLMRVEDENTRQFYLDECAKSNWSTRQLERQINTFYYQRLLSSHDKDNVRNEIKHLKKVLMLKTLFVVLMFLNSWVWSKRQTFMKKTLSRD